MGQPIPISSAHNEGIDALVTQMLAGLPVEEEPEGDPDEAIRIAVVGRPECRQVDSHQSFDWGRAGRGV
jgi:GTP-binding protein